MALEVFPQPTEHLEEGGVHSTAAPVQEPCSALVLGPRALARLVGALAAANMGIPRACLTGKEEIILRDPPFHILWASCSYPFSALHLQWWLRGKCDFAA